MSQITEREKSTHGPVSLEMQRKGSMSHPPALSDLNIMLLGLTGAGKSASGNTILGGDEETYFTSESKICAAAHRLVDGRRITVIDTMGLSDTAVKITGVQTQTEQMLQHTQLDVFLLVIKLGETFTKEKRKAVKRIQEIFGAKVLKHTIVLFTHGDQLRVSIEDYLGECESLRSLVDQCSGAFHVFNNKDGDGDQVTELLDKIESLRRKNGYRRYTEQHYKTTRKNLWLKKCVIFVAAMAAAAAAVLAGAVLRAGAGLLGGGGVLGGQDVLGGADVLRGAGVGEAGMIMASVAPPPTTLLETAGGAALVAVAFCAALYFLARKYFSRENDGRD